MFREDFAVTLVAINSAEGYELIVRAQTEKMLIGTWSAAHLPEGIDIFFLPYKHEEKTNLLLQYFDFSTTYPNLNFKNSH